MELGDHRLTLASTTLTATLPVSTGLDLLLTATAPLLAQEGGGLPTVALASRDQQKILLAIRPGVNIRKQPNGEVLIATAAEIKLAYDAITAAAIDRPVRLSIRGEAGDTSLLGQAAGNYSWVPVRMDGATAWVGSVVILAASRE
jgi:hypothetical protein